MRQLEQKLWHKINGVMRLHWDAQRHEDRYSKDIPDVSFAFDGVQGWMELKAVGAWPKSMFGALKIPHFTQGQRNWLTRRWERAPGVFLFLRVGNEYLIFSGKEAFNHVGRDWDKTKCRLYSLDWWENTVQRDALMKALHSSNCKDTYELIRDLPW